MERTFAHVCETGGARRTWLTGIGKVHKRHLMAAMAHNLSCLMRALFGMGTPRALQKEADLSAALLRAVHLALLATGRFLAAVRAPTALYQRLMISRRLPRLRPAASRHDHQTIRISTGC